MLTSRTPSPHIYDIITDGQTQMDKTSMYQLGWVGRVCQWPRSAAMRSRASSTRQPSTASLSRHCSEPMGPRAGGIGADLLTLTFSGLKGGSPLKKVLSGRLREGGGGAHESHPNTINRAETEGGDAGRRKPMSSD